MDLWRGGGKLTYRRLQVYIDQLPPESCTKTDVRDSLGAQQLAAMASVPDDDKYGSWSHLELLIAGLSDRLDWVIWAVLASQGGKPKEPTPMRRPGVGRSGRQRAVDTDRLLLLRNRGVA
jgi:hypothetical protein